jgi:cellulose synthase/poly-beta-1,6-N-acetylglucosamine synthase-like glycosyltransferase
LPEKDEKRTKHTSRARKAARIKLRTLQIEVEKLSRENKIAADTQIAELKGTVKALESENALLVKATVQQRPPEKIVAQEADRVPVTHILTSIWFFRALALVPVIILAGFLLAYDFIFVNTFLVYGNTTSYFPWAWGVAYTDGGPVQSLFNGALVLSISIIASCIVAMYAFALKIRESGRPRSKK